MKRRLGVWLPRFNHLKTLLPVMREAKAAGHSVTVLMPTEAMIGSGKSELAAYHHAPAFIKKWPWAQWSVLHQAPGSWVFADAIISSGVAHDGKMIAASGVPWVAVDHLGENAWWYLTGHRDYWVPFHRVCLSGAEADFLGSRPHGELPDNAVVTGYTAFDTEDEPVRDYGIARRYMLVGTAVRAHSIDWTLWQSYFAPNALNVLARTISGYRGATYGWILRVLRDHCLATGMAFVGKGRWKHEPHPAHKLFDHYFDDDPLDPHRAWNLMRGASVYAGGIGGLAVEALTAMVPTINWTYYTPPEMVDHEGFKATRRALWSGPVGVWQAPGLGKLFRINDPVQWKGMVGYLDTLGFYGHYAPNGETLDLRERIIGRTKGASARVLEACGL